MQIPLLLSLLAAHASAILLNCDHIRVDHHSFDLEKLGGPRSVVTTVREPPSYSNTTYTVDICRPLEKKKGVPNEEQCPNGARVCAIQRTYNDRAESGFVRKVIPIAGDLVDHGGFDFEFEASRLQGSDSNSDSRREGLRLILKGGAYPLDGPKKKKTRERAVIEFICDPDMEGTEGEWSPDEHDNGDGKSGGDGKKGDDDGKNDDDGKSDKRDGGLAAAGTGSLLESRGAVGYRDGEEQLIKDGAALKFISFDKEEDSEFETLRLEWRTKYACESTFADERAGRWGFFTWFIIVGFMLTAAYLIFGSWLNYTRYGARGWDLLPHGDTIRDVPYLMKDWTRSVLNTVQGSGSRGGYSAV